MTAVPSLRRYLFIGHVVIPAIINLVVNFAFGLLAMRGREHMPVFGFDGSAIADWIITSFLLPLITCLIATPLVRRDRDKGCAPDVGFSPSLLKLPRIRGPLLWRAIQWGFFGLALCAVPIAVVGFLQGTDAMASGRFVAIKCALAVMLGTIASPLIAMSTLSEKRP